jgi:superfamily II DNA or RNA helicase
MEYKIMNEDDLETSPLTPEEELKTLDEEDLFFLQITALLDDRIPREELFRIMKALIQAPGIRGRWESSQAAARLRQLRNQGLIDDHNRCHPKIREIIARRPLDFKIIELCRQLLRSSFINQPPTQEQPERLCAHTLRNFRLALLAHDFETLQQYLPTLHRAPYNPRYRHPYAALTLYPFDPEWFRSLPLPLQFAALDDCLTHSLEDLVVTPELDNFILETYPADQPGNRPFVLLYAQKLLFSGRLEELERLCQNHQELFSGSGFKGAMATLQGDFQAAEAHFQHDLEFARSRNSEGTTCFEAPIIFFYTLTLGHTQTAAVWDQVQETLACGREQLIYNPYTRDLFLLSEILLQTFRGLTPLARDLFRKLERRPTNSLFTLLEILASYWLNGTLAEGECERLAELEVHCQEHFPWIAIESRALLELNQESPKPIDTSAKHQPLTTPAITGKQPEPLSPAITFEPAWQRTLEALRQLQPDTVAATRVEENEPAMRLAWFIDLKSQWELTIIPRIQKRSDGGWSPGRNFALGRIYDGERLPFFSDLDERLCRTLRRQPNGKGDEFFFDQLTALPLLAEHPHLFLRGHPKIPATLSQAPIAIVVQRIPDNETLIVRLSPDPEDDDFRIVRAGKNRFIFYLNNPRLKEIARLLGHRGLRIPISARKELAATLEPLSSITPVYTNDSQLANLGDAASPIDNPVIHLQIHPAGSGLGFAIKVKPLGEQGSDFFPGQGFRYLLTTSQQERITIERNLELEREYLARLYQACPELIPPEHSEDHPYRQIDDLEQCLDILSRLQDLQNELQTSDLPAWLVCEWPAGKRLGLKKPSAGGAFRLNITPCREWFKIEGGLKTNENEIVSLMELLRNIDRGPADFIPLKENQFVAISRELRQRLNELRFYLSEEDGELMIHRAAAGAVGELLEGLEGVSCDTLWDTRRQQLAAAADYRPQLPDGLKTELRSYQTEGFAWLARLAHLGFGACLADDMGLGKTIQALALILSRAEAGPVLVVAPTSVCDNWIRECEQFAPSLNPITFGGHQRQELVEGLKPHDLLVCSYTMLQQEQELLVERTWEIIVLDEAQAIKNMNTKRSRAAMSLKGNFRLITTGTPMENHLGELWNLFNFINPGLLGTLEQFNRRFAQPIEQEKDENARQHLRRLLQPYILRRTKAQVLRELPPRTEILLQVELGPEERNFYEAVRRQAIANLEEVSRENETRNGGGRNTSIQVLAELTRLRLAACNPRLVAPESTLSSAKLELFGRIVGDLTTSGHRALVFSQFVKHLALIREYLDRQKISYRYLDGSTPKAKRQLEINAFQEGGTELFLISLKAGGLGLNLTAADYVIHLDPWWNPAIEDQASDRAHRIGQTRPVTVYRLITRATIEEKIVRLHQEKRNLADQILSASDRSARFSTTELLQLIKEGV